jgi:hypothetical protein
MEKVMFTMAIGHGGQAKGWGPGKAMRAAAALVILFLVSIAVNALTILADHNLRQPSSAAGDSSVITQQAGRLA